LSITWAPWMTVSTETYNGTNSGPGNSWIPLMYQVKMLQTKGLHTL